MVWNITLTDVNGNEIKKVEVDMPKEFDERAKEEEKLWCRCGYETDGDAEYVEDYLGVDHGWICPKCQKFVQIG